MQIGDPSVRERVQYASGNLGKSWVWATFDTVLLYFLSTIAGVPLSTVGQILFFALVWDGCFNLFLSYVADRWRDPYVFRYLLVAGGALCSVSFFLIFLFGLNGITRDPAYIAIICFLCRSGYTLCDVAHNSMLANMAVTPQTASSVSAMRLSFSAAGSIAVGIAFKHALELNGPTFFDNFLIFAIIGSIIYIITLFQSLFIRQSILNLSNEIYKGSSKSALYTIIRDKTYIKVCILVLIHSGIISLIYKSLPFFGKYTIGSAAWSGDALVYLTFGKLVTLILLQFLSSRISSNRLLLAFSYIVLASALLLLLIVTTTVPAFIPIALLVIGGAEAGVGMCIWALLSSSVHSSLSGAGLSPALPVGVFLALLKAANGLSTVIFTQGLEIGATHGLTSQAVLGIIMICMPVAACVVSIYVATRKSNIPN